MKKHLLLCLTAASLISVSSCNDKNDEYDDVGKSTIVSLKGPEKAYMGDSIAFIFNVADDGEVPLSTSKVQLLYGDEIVSERIVLTGKSGEYSGKILFPLMKNIPDGDATLKIRVQNARYAGDVKEMNVAVSRPSYPYLLLKTKEGGEYRMMPVSGKPNTYAVTDHVKTEQDAYIVAPKYGENGNEIPFGSLDGKIANGVKTNIEFTADTEGEYEITFNTLTFEGTPFIKFALNDVEFNKQDDNNWFVDMELEQGQEIRITGLKSDYANYWIDPSFFDIQKNTTKKVLKFRAMNGKYKVTVNKAMKYFNVEVLNGTSLSSFDKDKGEGALWMLGGGGIGKPSYAANGINWDPGKGFCATPIAKGKYQLILEGGRTLKTDDINFKYFGQKGWGFEMASAYVTTASPYIRINPGPGDDGNIFSGSEAFKEDKFYIINLDLPSGFPSSPGVITIEEVDEIPEVE